jgi:hypothetical protein
MGHNLQSFGLHGVTGESSNNIFPVRTATKWNLDYPSMFHHGGHQEFNTEWYRYLRNANFNQSAGWLRANLWVNGATATTNMRNPLTGALTNVALNPNDLYIAFLQSLVAVATHSQAPFPTFGQEGWDIIALMYAWEVSGAGGRGCGCGRRRPAPVVGARSHFLPARPPAVRSAWWAGRGATRRGGPRCAATWAWATTRRRRPSPARRSG